MISGAGTWLVFWMNPARFPIFPHPYMLCVITLWMALRFGPRTAATTLTLIGVIAILATGLGHGSYPLGGATRTDRLLMVQTFLGIVGGVSLLLAISQGQRRASEDLLRRSEARFRTIADNLPNSMIYQVMRENDGTMKFLHLSANVERFTGVSVEANLADSARLYDRIIEEDRPKILAAREASFQAMDIFKATIRMRGLDDQLHWVQLCSSPRRQEDGRVIWDGIGTDVTELIRTKQALTASETLLQQFIKYTPAAVAMFDTDMRYLQASDRWLLDYNLAEQDILGRSHYEVLPELPARWKEIHHRALNGVTESNEQDFFERADGSVQWLQWEVPPMVQADGRHRRRDHVHPMRHRTAAYGGRVAGKREPAAFRNAILPHRHGAGST
ncbi:MAG: PAS domain S-box protein [Verrucomicrobiota bacterium]